MNFFLIEALVYIQTLIKKQILQTKIIISPTIIVHKSQNVIK